jgi:hypothetical protein
MSGPCVLLVAKAEELVRAPLPNPQFAGRWISS